MSSILTAGSERNGTPLAEIPAPAVWAGYNLRTKREGSTRSREGKIAGPAGAWLVATTYLQRTPGSFHSSLGVSLRPEEIVCAYLSGPNFSCGYSSKVEQVVANDQGRVQFPLPAPGEDSPRCFRSERKPDSYHLL